ncbi:right-handed parallel beta-helix repeat-containing protein [candidate division KSB1 bacterium]|nr:right-handed parallel beta-helix repeat-containing protein [candidate division KSB1 bacterium]
MNKIKFLLAILTLAMMIAGCQNDDPIQAPNRQESAEAADLAVMLEKNLEAELQSLRKAASRAREITGPTTITASGVYEVVNDFSATSDAIVIRADRVLLDLDDHVITGPGNKTGRGIVLDGVSRVLVKDGTLKTFGAGVVLLNSSQSAVKEIEIRGGDEPANPPAGHPPQIGILLVNSYRNLILENDCKRVNLGLFVRGGGSHDNLILHNSARGGNNGLLGICYNPAEGQGQAGPTNDLVAGNLLNRFGTGIQASAGSAQNKFNHNTIYYFNKAWEDFNGTNEFRGNRTRQIAP